MMKRMLLLFAFFTLTIGMAATAGAHEFLVRPVKFLAAEGELVPFSVLSAHIMMISEEVEPLEFVDLALFDGSGTTELNVVANENLLMADGRVAFKTPGTAILAGHRRGVVWTQTTKGWVQGSKKGLTDVIKSNKYEKFSKAFVTVGTADHSWKKPLGHKLELMPLAAPTTLSVGDVLPVQILVDGKPAAAGTVLATYDGFSYDEMAFAGSYEPSGEGIANIHITAPGVWMVRVEYKVEGDSEEYNDHVLRSVMLFEAR